MSEESVDSPFHCMSESPLDRRIHATKTQFVAELRTRLEQHNQIITVELTHPVLSNYICVKLHVKFPGGTIHVLNFFYEMDKHTFARRDTTLAVLLSRNPEMEGLIIDVLRHCFEVNQLPGLGTRTGETWITNDAPSELALREFHVLT